MSFYFLALLLSLSISGPSDFAHAELISMTVGRANERTFTSREAHMQHLLEQSLQPGKTSFEKQGEDSKIFFDQVEKLILEFLISEESKNFSTVRLSDEEFQQGVKRVPEGLFKSPAWKSIEPSQEEWKEVLRRKFQAKKFIQFRAQSSVIPVSDVEAKRYFDENRMKFGNLPFEQFKENIKVFLRRSQVEQRLKDWYDVLRSKYRSRNYLSEI